MNVVRCLAFTLLVELVQKLLTFLRRNLIQLYVAEVRKDVIFVLIERYPVSTFFHFAFIEVFKEVV